MNVALLLEMAAAGRPDGVAVGSRAGGLTYGELHRRACAGAARVRRSGAARVLYVAPNHDAYPVAVFASALAGASLVPLNYRLGHEQLVSEMAEQRPAYVIATGAAADAAAAAGLHAVTPQTWIDAAGSADTPPSAADPEGIALILYTSGTTAAPKQAILRHRHLVSYVTGTVEFASASETEAALVSMPPYHIAGYSSILSNVYACRRIVELGSFTPESWLTTVRAEGITHAVVVPTMLARIVRWIDERGGPEVPTLRSLVYGGARMSPMVIERALSLFPNADFVNAYGLTETSSTVAVLAPDDHRAAMTETDPRIRARLGSVGRVVPGVEVEIRDAGGAVLAAGETGDIWLRGDQISGEYVGQPPATDVRGWYPTRDRGRLDDGGYLFVDGRSDDTIIRGGENIAPGEIEDVIMRHPAVAEVCVVGREDEEWGQRIAAAVVLRAGTSVRAEVIREWVRAALRSSKTPDEIVFCETLPRTDTGKILRREVLARIP